MKSVVKCETPKDCIPEVVLSQHFLRVACFYIVKTLSEELLDLKVFIQQSRAVESNIITAFVTKKLEK